MMNINFLGLYQSETSLTKAPALPAGYVVNASRIANRRMVLVRY